MLILDDFGLRSLDSINRNYFMGIIEDRHGKRTTIIASQLPVEAWHQITGEQTIADAILDSMRKKLIKKALNLYHKLIIF